MYVGQMMIYSHYCHSSSQSYEKYSSTTLHIHEAVSSVREYHLKMLIWPWLSWIDWHRTGARSWLNITEYHCQHTHHTLVTTAASPLTTTTPHQVTGHQSHVPASSHVDHDQCHTVTRLLVYDKTIIWLVGAGAEAVSHTGSHCIRWVETLV